MLGDDPKAGPLLAELYQLSTSAPAPAVGREIVEALRVGAPPPRCSDLTVGRAKERGLFVEMFGKACRSGALRATIVSAPGDGVSHLLNWAGEQASERGLACLRLAPDDGVVPEAGYLLQQTRIRGRPLIEVLPEYLPALARVEPLAASSLVREVAAVLDQTGADLVASIWAAACRNEAALVELIERLDNSPLLRPSSARRGSAAGPGWAEASLLGALARLTGAPALGIVVDGSDRWSSPSISWLLEPLPGNLRNLAVLYGGVDVPSQRGQTQVRVAPLSLDERTELAARVRLAHFAGYGWRGAPDVAGARVLAGWDLRAASTREFVQWVIGRLDEQLASLPRSAR